MDRRLGSGRRAVTLLELLIGMVLFALISLGFYSVDTFSRRQVITADRQAQVQNEVSIALDHITKNVTRAIGSTVLFGQDPVDLTSIGGDISLRIFIDSSGDGKRGAGDRWIAYRYRGAGAAAADRYQLWYYPDYSYSPSTYEVIARRISAFSRSRVQNIISLGVTACWDPSVACGTMQNPRVTMSANASMPSVSTN